MRMTKMIGRWGDGREATAGNTSVTYPFSVKRLFEFKMASIDVALVVSARAVVSFYGYKELKVPANAHDIPSVSLSAVADW